MSSFCDRRWLSRAVAQLLVVRHQDRFEILQSWLVWRRFEQFGLDEQAVGSWPGFSSRRFDAAGKCGSLPFGERLDLPDFIMEFTFLMPNQSLEPTAVGAVSSAVAVHAASRRWLSFLR